MEQSDHPPLGTGLQMHRRIPAISLVEPLRHIPRRRHRRPHRRRSGDHAVPRRRGRGPLLRRHPRQQRHQGPHQTQGRCRDGGQVGLRDRVCPGGIGIRRDRHEFPRRPRREASADVEGRRANRLRHASRQVSLSLIHHPSPPNPSPLKSVPLTSPSRPNPPLLPRPLTPGKIPLHIPPNPTILPGPLLRRPARLRRLGRPPLPLPSHHAGPGFPLRGAEDDGGDGARAGRGREAAGGGERAFAHAEQAGGDGGGDRGGRAGLLRRAGGGEGMRLDGGRRREEEREKGREKRGA